MGISKKEMIVVALVVVIGTAVFLGGGAYLLGRGIARDKSQEASKYLEQIENLQTQIADAGKLHVVRNSTYDVTVLRQVDNQAGFKIVEVQFGQARIMAVMEHGAKVIPGSIGCMINVWFSQFDGSGSVVPFVLTHEP